MRTLAFLAICAGLALPSLVHADEHEPPLSEEIIHSPLPLYTFEWDELWPRSFHTTGPELSDVSFGCTWMVSTGDWRFTPSMADGYPVEMWDRVTNYGVFHCAAVLRTAYERGELAKAPWEYGHFVRIGRTRLESDEWELWVIQKGTVPGSEYTLLARRADEGPVDSFVVLQRQCPPQAILEIDGLDVWSTRYCSVTSQAELLALAHRMIALEPLGMLRHVPELLNADE